MNDDFQELCQKNRSSLDESNLNHRASRRLGDIAALRGDRNALACCLQPICVILGSASIVGNADLRVYD